MQGILKQQSSQSLRASSFVQRTVPSAVLLPSTAARNVRSIAARRLSTAKPRIVPAAAAPSASASSNTSELSSAKNIEEVGESPFNRVAYQGLPGAYNEVAARKACPDFDPMPCEQSEVAFQALSQRMAERAVVPIEDSLGGSMHEIYDLLIRYRLHIVGETSLQINHCLCAVPGIPKSEVKRVRSHPQVLNQCDAYLRRMGVVREVSDNTATAAQLLARSKTEDVAVICSRRAAELYELDVLEEGINDVKGNVTRFITLSREPSAKADNDERPFKTSIVFSLGEGPGQLFRALSVFSLRDIDMTKMESRPLRSKPIVQSKNADGSNSGQRFNYLFYVDFVGTLAEERVQNALRHLQETAPFMRVLGSYPMDPELIANKGASS